MNVRETDRDFGRFSPVLNVATLLGAILGNAMAVSLFLWVTLNGPALYRAEKHSTEVILGAIRTLVELGVFFAAWVPIAICVLAFAIVIAGVAIVIWTTWVQQALAQISRLAALCPTLP